MGAKTGYATAILRVLGLRPGQGHTDGTRYLWCEPDAGVRLLLEAYRDRELAQAAAEVIRSWKDEDPRELWERLRAEGPARHVCEAREVARWAWIQHQNMRRRPLVNRNGELWTVANTPDAGGGMYQRPQRRECHDPQEIADTIAACEFCSGRGWAYVEGDRCPSCRGDGLVMVEVPATIAPDARAVEFPTRLPPGTVAYMDPPYVGTTGYAHDLGRDAVVELARRWADAGALVCISEAEPIGALVADGWHAVEITGERRGQKRTFSAQQREWLTLNRQPAWVPSVQASLFGAA